MSHLYEHTRKLCKQPWLEPLLVVGVIAIGFVLRLRFYFSDRSLWLDELFLAELLRERTWRDGFEPLGLGQVVTPGYFLLLEFVSSVFSMQEWALRLPSLVPGLVLLPVLYFAFKPLCKRSTMLFLLLTASCNMWLIYYSAEVKPYAIDVLVAVLFFWLMRLLLEKESKWLWAAWGGLCVLGLFFSLTAYLIGAITGIVLLICFIKNDRSRILPLILTSLPGVLYGVLQWSLVLKAYHGSDPVDQYWIDYGAFMPWDEPLQALLWFVITPFDWMTQPVGATNIYGVGTVASGVLLCVGVYGFVRLAKRNSILFCYAAIACLLVLALVMFQLYPARGRVILFLYPALLLAIAFALNDLFTFARVLVKRLSKQQMPWSSGALLCMLVLLLAMIYQPMFRTSVLRFHEPPHMEPTPHVLADLKAGMQAGDKVYVYFWGKFAFLHYAPEFGLEQSDDLILGWHMEMDHDAYGRDILKKFGGQSRVWLVLIHTQSYWPLDHHDVIRDQLHAAGGSLISDKHYSGAHLLLYNLEQAKKPELNLKEP